MTTSGSSGRKGLFVYDQGGWAGIVGQFLRIPAWWRRQALAPAHAHGDRARGSLTHMSVQGLATLPVGVHCVLSPSVTAPRGRGGGAQPLPSALRQRLPVGRHALAEEQEAGRLRIAPRAMSTSMSCARTP